MGRDSSPKASRVRRSRSSPTSPFWPTLPHPGRSRGLSLPIKGGKRSRPMSRTTALLGSALFLVLAPGTIAGLMPWLIVRWPAPLARPALATLGGLVLALGLVLLVDCF